MGVVAGETPKAIQKIVEHVQALPVRVSEENSGHIIGGGPDIVAHSDNPISNLLETAFLRIWTNMWLIQGLGLLEQVP